MILTVTLNTAIDRTVAVPNFQLGRRHRAVESRTVAGGKGINVARALRLLGKPVIATGFVGGGTGRRVLSQLDAEGILHDFAPIAGETRTNLSVVDPTTGEQTEINERGPEVTGVDLEDFIEKLLYLASGARICVLAGSVPPGAPADVYATLISELRSRDVLTVLDTDGDPMRAGLRGEPAVVAPNVREAEEAVGHEFSEPEDLALGLTGLIEMGADEAIITTEYGCNAVVGPDRRGYEVSIEPLEPVATVGSGDAFLAGYVAARYEGADEGDCLAFGVACGAESTQHFGAGTLAPREVDRLVSRVQVTELPPPAGGVERRVASRAAAD